MNTFPQIVFELNYEWSSEGRKKRSLDTLMQTSRCAHMTLANVDKLEKKKMKPRLQANNMDFELVSDLAKSQKFILQDSVH